MKLEEEAFPPCERLGSIMMQQQTLLRTSGLLLAELGATVAGYLLFARSGNSGLITKLAVGLPFRRQGIGSTLLKQGIAELERPGRRTTISEIQLHVDPTRTAAQSLYESHGFVREVLLTGYYGDARDALLMCRRHSVADSSMGSSQMP